MNHKKSLVYSLKQLLFLAFFVQAISSCGKVEENRSSQIKVTNGEEISENEFPAVSKIEIVRAVHRWFVYEEYSFCTGTFVNDYQMITAAHCVYGMPELRPKIFFIKSESLFWGDERVQARRVTSQPLYTKENNSGVNQYDVAIVDFPPNTARAVMEIADESPYLSEKVTLVGYGDDHDQYSEKEGYTGTGGGKKRMGRNKIANRDFKGMILINGIPEADAEHETGQDSLDGHGDSGGPLLANGKIIAVCSGLGYWNHNDWHGLYANLNLPVNRNFIRENLDLDFPGDRYTQLNIQSGDDNKSQLGDWFYGAHKGTCPENSRLIGLSRDQRGLCTNTEQEDLWPISMYKVVAVHENYGDLRLGDWAGGHTKYECPPNYMAAGFSRHHWGTSGILCRPAANPLGKQCRTLWFNNHDARASHRGGDFAPWSYKGQCSRLEYLAGIAQRNGYASAILCCR